MLGGCSDSPRAGTREQQGDTNNFVMYWEQGQFCVSELILLNFSPTSASHKLDSTVTGFGFWLENMIKTWRERAEGKNSTQKNGARWRPHSYIYSVTEEGQTELLHKGVNITFSFYLQPQNDTSPLWSVLFSKTQQRILISYKRHFCFSDFLKNEEYSAIA